MPGTCQDPAELRLASYDVLALPHLRADVPVLERASVAADDTDELVGGCL